MTKRYGRNQRREARKTIESLERQIVQTRRDAERDRASRWDAEARARNARSEVLVEYIEKHGMIQMAMDKIAHELGSSLGPHIMPYAEKLAASSRDANRKPLVVSATVYDQERRYTTIRGEIPSLNYNVVVF